jgi:putative hydroxymethylpyrimidine transporter CytX
MSLVADLIARRLFGWSARPMWLGVIAVVCTGLALWGPVGVTRIWLKRFSAWVVVAICLALTFLLFSRGHASATIAVEGTGGWPTVGGALDLVIAMPVSWLPLVADYNRFAMRPRSAFTGTFVGYFVANVWLYSLGVLLVLAAGAAATPAGVAAGILGLAGGSLAGVLFLAALLVGETDEAFADMYSGALSLRNVVPALAQRPLIVVIAAAATLLAGWLSMARYESFLFLIGSVFVPLFGCFAAHRLVSPRHGEGTRRAVEAVALVPWLLGFIVYHWVSPTGPDWWLELTARAVGDPLIGRFGWLPASLPSFGVSFLVALLLLRDRGAHRSPTAPGTGRLSS